MKEIICAIIGHNIKTMKGSAHQMCLRCDKILDWRTGEWLTLNQWRVKLYGNNGGGA